jgi:probable HAF family extracellular repeat protein
MKKRFLAALMLAPVWLLAQVSYSVVSLEAGWMNTPQSTALGINQGGDVVGVYFTPGFTELRAYKYSSGGGAQDLGSLGGTATYATGINAFGQIVGYGNSAGNSIFSSFRDTPGGSRLPLGSLGGAGTEANGINNHGQVAGSSALGNGSEHAFRYSDGFGMQDLGSLFGGNSRAYAINDNGWVTGQSDGFNAFLYRDGVGMTYLGPGVGRAINEQGTVVGDNGVGFGLATLYRNGETTLLGHLGGNGSLAFSINRSEQVVGTSLDGENRFRAFIWSEQDGMVNLNDRIDPNSGWILGDATAINDAGQIVGLGLFNGKQTAYLLNAVPEPSTWALLLLGTGALLFLRRRKA